jgi:hypothetical protein
MQTMARESKQTSSLSCTKLKGRIKIILKRPSKLDYMLAIS